MRFEAEEVNLQDRSPISEQSVFGAASSRQDNEAGQNHHGPVDKHF